jgi:hypothetical protein
MKNKNNIYLSFAMALFLPAIFAIILKLIGIKIPFLKLFTFMIYGPLYFINFLIINVNPIIIQTIILVLRSGTQIPLTKRHRFFYVWNVSFVFLWAIIGLAFGLLLNQS